ncbi:MAG: aminotransferase class IV [Bdellovibrionales bacterium]|nr:aminotransferase class IV [Bdellovibrionales bacterium]
MELCFRNSKVCLPSDLPDHLRTERGVFETFCAYRRHDWNGHVWVRGFALHSKRLAAGAAELGLSVPASEKIYQALVLALRAVQWEAVSRVLVRMIVVPQGYFFRLTNWVDQWQETLDSQGGIDLRSIHATRPTPSIKSCLASVSLTARAEAERQGAHEALLIDPNGTVREGAWSNFFWVDQADLLHTCGNGVLPGVTREKVLELCHDEMEFVLQEDSLNNILGNVKEAFITQATRGITPVRKINKSVLTCRPPGRITASLLARFEALRYCEEDLIF